MRLDLLTVMFDEPDGLRLVGLGRIPRCADCPRYSALVEAFHERREGATASRRLPAVPAACGFEACAPLARRYAAPIPVHAAPRATGRAALAS